MYRQWSPDGLRDGKRVSGRKSWDSDGDADRPRRRSKKDETRRRSSDREADSRKNKRDKERDPHSSNGEQERRSDAGRDGERPVGVIKRDGNDPLGDDKMSGLRMMEPMMSDVEAQCGVKIGEAIRPKGTGTEGEDAH
jgi:hypothetical protein